MEEYQLQKQILVEKFTRYLYNSDVFDVESCHDMLVNGKIDDKIEREFYRFIGKEKVPLCIYEKIDKNKFIELTISYFYGNS